MLLPEISTSMENYLKMFYAGIPLFVYQLCESCRYLNSAVQLVFPFWAGAQEHGSNWGGGGAKSMSAKNFGEFGISRSSEMRLCVRRDALGFIFNTAD